LLVLIIYNLTSINEIKVRVLVSRLSIPGKASGVPQPTRHCLGENLTDSQFLRTVSRNVS
jgi:hypothetical protein